MSAVGPYEDPTDPDSIEDDESMSFEDMAHTLGLTTDGLIEHLAALLSPTELRTLISKLDLSLEEAVTMTRASLLAEYLGVNTSWQN